MKTYTFLKRLDRKYVLIQHPRIGAQRWRIARVRSDSFCRVCKHLIPAQTLAWKPDTTMGNAHDHICLLCVRQWEKPIIVQLVTFSEYKRLTGMTPEEAAYLAEHNDEFDDEVNPR